METFTRGWVFKAAGLGASFLSESNNFFCNGSFKVGTFLLSIAKGVCTVKVKEVLKNGKYIYSFSE